MNIYTYLKNDHQHIQKLMDTIESIGMETHSDKTKAFNQLKELLIIHSKAEEKVFYQPLKEFSETKDKVIHGKKEHSEAEELLEELTDESLTGAAWFQKFKTLKNAVEHHVEEEENEIFNQAKKVLTKNDEVAMHQEMKNEKAQLQKNQTIKARQS